MPCYLNWQRNRLLICAIMGSNPWQGTWKIKKESAAETENFVNVTYFADVNVTNASVIRRKNGTIQAYR